MEIELIKWLQELELRTFRFFHRMIGQILDPAAAGAKAPTPSRTFRFSHGKTKTREKMII